MRGKKNKALDAMHDSFFMGYIEDLVSVKAHLDYAKAWSPGANLDEKRSVSIARHNAREQLTAHIREMTALLSALCHEDQEHEHMRLMTQWVGAVVSFHKKRVAKK